MTLVHMKRTHGFNLTESLVALLLLALPVTILSQTVQSGDESEESCQHIQWACEDNPRCSHDMTGITSVNILNEPCGFLNYCIIPNSICENNRCQCQHGFYQECNTCQRGSLLDEWCTDAKQCEGYTPNSQCQEEKCICEQGYFVYKEKFCKKGTAIGDSCSSSESCISFASNSVCSDGICECVPGFSLDTTTHQCRRGSLGDECISTLDCSQYIAKSECQNGTCLCQGGFQGDGVSSCTPAKEESTDLSSHVLAPEALTMKQYTPKITVGTPCRYDSDCPAPEFFCKTDELKCTCAAGYEVDGNTCKKFSVYAPQPIDQNLKPVALRIPSNENRFSPHIDTSYNQPFSTNPSFPSYPLPQGYPQNFMREPYPHPVQHNVGQPTAHGYGAPSYHPNSNYQPSLPDGYSEIPFNREQFSQPGFYFDPAMVNFPQPHPPIYQERPYHGNQHMNPVNTGHILHPPHEEYPPGHNPNARGHPGYPPAHHSDSRGQPGYPAVHYPNVRGQPGYPPFPPPTTQYHFPRQPYNEFSPRDPYNTLHGESNAAQYYPLLLKKLADAQRNSFETGGDSGNTGYDEKEREDGYRTITIPASELYPQPEGADVLGGGYGYPCTEDSECKFQYLRCNEVEYKCDCVRGYILENSECVKSFAYKLVPGVKTSTKIGQFQYMVKNGNPCKTDSDCISRGLICNNDTCDCAFGYDKTGQYCVFKYDYKQSSAIIPTVQPEHKGTKATNSKAPSPSSTKTPQNHGYPPQGQQPSPFRRPEISTNDYSPPFHPYHPVDESRPYPSSPYTNPQFNNPNSHGLHVPFNRYSPQSEFRPEQPSLDQRPPYERPPPEFHPEHPSFDQRPPYVRPQSELRPENTPFDQRPSYEHLPPGFRPERLPFDQRPPYELPHSEFRPEHPPVDQRPPYERPHSEFRPEHQPVDQRPPYGHPHSDFRPEQPRVDQRPPYERPHSEFRPEHPPVDQQPPYGRPHSEFRPEHPPVDQRPPYERPHSEFRPEHPPVDQRTPYGHPDSDFRPEQPRVDQRSPYERPHSEFRPEHPPVDQRPPYERPHSEFRPEHPPVDQQPPHGRPYSEFRPEHPPVDQRPPYGRPHSEFRPEQPAFQERIPYTHPYPSVERPSYRPPASDFRPPSPPHPVGLPHPPFQIPADQRPPLFQRPPNPPTGRAPPTLNGYGVSYQHPPISNASMLPPYSQHRVDQVSGLQVAPLISVCYSNADCSRPYTFCSPKENRCVCYKGFVAQGMDCVSGSVPYTFEQSYISGITYEDFCTTNIDCKTPYGVCVNFHCQCQEGYSKRGRDCLAAIDSGRRGLDEPCSEHGHCRETFSFCHERRCQCARGYIRYASRCVATYGYLPSECTTNKDCKIQNSECDKHRSKCKCRYGYAKYLQSCREAGHLHGQCLPDSSCAIPNLFCYQAHQRCKCGEGFVEDGLGCQHYAAGSLGSLCVPQVHAPSGYLPECQRGFQCRFGKCRCPEGFHKKGTHCSAGGSVLGSQCVDSLDCPVGNIDCVDGWCGCSSGYFFYLRSCMLIQHHFGASCQTENECEGSHMTCHERRCVCKSGYTQQRYECVAQKDSEYFQTEKNTRYPRADVDSGGGSDATTSG